MHRAAPDSVSTTTTTITTVISATSAHAARPGASQRPGISSGTAAASVKAVSSARNWTQTHLGSQADLAATARDARDSAGRNDALAKESLRALATLSSGTAVLGKKALAVNPYSTKTGWRSSAIKPGSTKPLENPFLDHGPPSKLAKHHRHTSFSAAGRSSLPLDAFSVASNSHLASSQVGSVKRTEGLSLTRVLPINHIGQTSDAANKASQSALNSASTASSFSSPSTSAASVANGGGTARPEGASKASDDQGFVLPASRSPPSAGHHLSTTPKQPPRADYFHYLRQSTSRGDLSTDEESDVNKALNIIPARTTFGASAMDFARKSIMQRATASPQSAIRKIQQVAAENNGAPSLMDLLTASDAKDVSDSQQARQSQQQYLSAQKLEQSFAKSDTPFTFESTPLPSSDNNRTSLPSSNTLVRSFLDFSDREEQQQREDMSLSRTFKQAPTSAGDDGTKEQDDSNRVDQKVMEHATLDLRAANLGDPLTAQQDLDNRRSAFLPRASMSQRPAPYTRPTVNERETLRANRAPHFRARPLDPKVFTSAGDLGVPRIRKLPLTIPVSPVFSKPRVKATSTIGTRPARTLTSARLTNLNKQQPDRRPVSHSNPAGAKGTRFEAQPGASGTGTDSDAGGSRKTMHSVSRPNQYLVNSAIDTHESSNLISNSSNKPKSAAMTAIYPSKPESQAALQGMSQSSSSRLSSGASMHKIIRGPPIRGEGATALTTTPAQSSDEHSKEPVVAEVAAVALRHSRAAPLLRRPLTQPVPFKFATDDILRRRRAMFQPRTASNPASQGVVSSSALRTTQIGKPKAAPVQRHPQPRLKRLTVPIPFQLATQRRAEIHNHYHHHDQPQQQRTRGDNGNEVLASIRLRRTSRLAGMPSLRSSLQASGEILPPGAATTGAIMGHKVRRSHFVPTIPISPKLGRHVPVAALGPTRFLLKKSTKELTQPHEFHFHSDDRAREREALEKSAVSRQQELEKLKNNAAIRLNKEREQRLRVRESMERTFRARPIRHYQPTTIHKSTIPLTKPVSPNIGEKRKRHEMEQQQQQEWKQFEQSLHSQDHPTQNPPLRQPVQHQNQQQYYMTDLDASVGQDMYQQFEEAKILQEEHHVLQQELSRQERRQLELANSPQATIHQPPIRLSFPLDPTLQADETQGGGGGPTSNDQNEGQQHQQMNVIPPLPPVIRDSFGGSNNHHLSRELRRISLEASRGSSGNYRQRLSDIASRSSGSGGANRRSESGGRSSSEGRTSSGDGNYYPFTRSQAPTASTHADAPSTLTTGKATEQDAENRRRSGSFIPLNMSAAEAPVNKRTIRDSPPPSRVSRLFGAPAVSLASAQLNRSKGPEVIDHRLSLSDL